MKELNAVFKMLRQEGFTARQRFMCCSGCAGAAIANEFKEKLDKDPNFTTKGFVFFHAQDQITEEDIRRNVYESRGPEMRLRFGPVEPSGTKLLIGQSCEEVGAAVINALEACNIEYEWSGNPDECITLFPFGKVQVPKPRFSEGYRARRAAEAKLAAEAKQTETAAAEAEVADLKAKLAQAEAKLTDLSKGAAA